MFASASLHAQQVEDTLKFVYAISDDGFVNVRTEPNGKAPIIGQIHMFNSVLSNGILLKEKNGTWVKIATFEGKTGWANSKFLETFVCSFEESDRMLVATANNTVIFNNKGGVYAKVKAGTFLADAWFHDDGEFYIIEDHSTLYIPKSQAKVVKKKRKP